MRIAYRVVILIVIIVVIIFYLSSRRNSTSLQKRTRFLMDTYCTIQAIGSRGRVQMAIDAAFDRMEEIDRKFNFSDPTSPLYDFNFKNIPINDSEIIELVRIAQSISERSDGTFDITVQPLLELWGFYGESPDLPQEVAIKDCLRKVGFRNIIMRDKQVESRQSGVHIDLGGIAKGYAISEALKVLKEAGIDSALIDAGGDIYVAGKIEGNYWNIGIKNPRGDGDMAAIQVSNMAVVTSGDYERFFTRDGMKYCHILDPRTGYPARGLISVTVISSDPVLADAWATALFVVGSEGMKYVEEMPTMEAMMVTADGKIILSSGLSESMVIDKQGVEK